MKTWGNIVASDRTIDQAWSDFRTERAARLSATDWIVLRNLETNEPIPQEWLDYRQALRDLTDNTDDPTSPNWPVSPLEVQNG